MRDDRNHSHDMDRPEGHGAYGVDRRGFRQKVEGNISCHTALSTTFPQPALGVGEGPGPLKVPVEELRKVLGLREVTYVPGRGSLAVVDSTLAEQAGAG